jgi:hypothetical protein
MICSEAASAPVCAEKDDVIGDVTLSCICNIALLRYGLPFRNLDPKLSTSQQAPGDISAPTPKELYRVLIYLKTAYLC